MKVLIWMLAVYRCLFADLPTPVWTASDAQIIETTETIQQTSSADNGINLSADDGVLLQDVPAGKNLDEIPLAKTYPVSDTTVSQTDTSVLVEGAGQSSMSPDHTGKAAERLQAIISREVAKVKATTVPESKQNATSLTQQQASEEDSIFETDIWRQVIAEHQMLTIALSGALGLLAVVLYLLWKNKSVQKDAAAISDESGFSAERYRWSLLERYSVLRGEVHQCFLERKQNILFNDDFTQYQKAKALIELEKEYTRIEFMELPKLFSEDFNRFLEAQQSLSARPELREVIERFIHKTLAASHYTKAQKIHIRENMKNHYNTPHHTWQYQKNMDQTESQTAYLLQ